MTQQSKITAKDIADFTARSIHNDVEKWFDNVIDQLLRNAEEMKRYKERYVAAANATKHDYFGGPAEVISWAVNQALTAPNNMRLDMAVTYASRLGDLRTSTVLINGESND